MCVVGSFYTRHKKCDVGSLYTHCKQINVRRGCRVAYYYFLNYLLNFLLFLGTKTINKDGDEKKTINEKGCRSQEGR